MNTLRGVGRGRRALVIAAAATAYALVAVSGANAAGSAGGAGIGDPYYPLYGNSGYDVNHYSIDVAYTPATDRIVGRTTVLATTTQYLTRFNLDLALKASAVTVNGRPATFTKPNWHELQITPATPLNPGTPLTVEIRYAGVPSTVTPVGPTTFSPWTRTADGAVAIGEPEIAAWWYPSNDHPRDKATFDIALTVPKGLEALSNGRLVGKTLGASTDTWRWRVANPMTTYLAFMAVGQFTVTRGTTAAGIPWLNAIAANGGAEAAAAAADLARTPEVVDWHASQWGPYPFEAMGGVAPAAETGFALENQTRPVYSRGFWAGGQSNIYVVVHELAHQWYGDSVSVTNWRDIWLNEGFATFSTWKWAETHGEGTANQILRKEYGGYAASDDWFWGVTIGDPGAAGEFQWPVYSRGAMTLQALRNRIGTATFMQLMRAWAKAHAGGNASIPQFISLAEGLSGQDLTAFFDAWLYTPSKPAATVANGLDPRWGTTLVSPAERSLVDATLQRIKAATLPPPGR